MAAMQGRGVPASIVSQGRDLHESAHLAARGFYRETRYYTAERGVPASRWQPGTGTGWTSPMSLSGTPLEFGSYSNVGEDNPYVFGEILAMPQGRIQELTDEGALY
jgi:crotonobetainyl-CoA:carnitine CoA-transferase CaiB-like acyl-CoA transferase